MAIARVKEIKTQVLFVFIHQNLIGIKRKAIPIHTKVYRRLDPKPKKVVPTRKKKQAKTS